MSILIACHASLYNTIELVVLSHLSHLSDTELLIKLCSENEDDDLYKEFISRFHSVLTEECRRICAKRKLDLHIGTQIAHECFEKVRKYKTFKIDEVKVKDCRKAVMAYLYRIILNLFNDYQRSAERKESVVVNKSYFDGLLEDKSVGDDPERLRQTKEKAVAVLNNLNPRERKVILTDLEYKRSQKYLPDDVIELLAAEFGVKKDTIRKIRERAIQKIKNAINEVQTV